MKLRDYQIDAVKRLQCGSILCGGVGSGKSVTALAYYYICNDGYIFNGRLGEYPMADPPMDLYIITTARKRDTLEWEKDMCPFLLTTKSEKSVYNHKVVVDSWNNLKKYVGVEKAFFIFDEQRVVGSGEWVKSFLKITPNNWWVLLSATPGDTWTDYIPVFIANGFYKNRTEFNREHVVYSRYGSFPKIERYLNTGRLIRLRNKILVNMDYRNEVEKIHDYVKCDYDRELYSSVAKKRWNLWKDEPIENASELCYALRRITNESEDRQLAVLDLFADRKKVIIFYNFDYELELLKSLAWVDCDGYAADIAEWNGHKHQPIPDSESWVYLVQYNAGAEGWNCIKTDTIIFYSQSYSYKIMTQAAGRIDRLNTPFDKLYFYHLVSNSGIDLAINKALRNKKDFNEKLFVRG